VPREQAREVHRLSAKPATNLDADNKKAASGAGNVWVCLMSLGSQGAAGIDIGGGVQSPDGRHDSSINC